MIPKTRVDALTDGIFAIVMTILVLEIKLPPHVQYQSAAELLRALSTLGSELIAYAISFFVLALFWYGGVTMRREDEQPSESYVRWLILHLFVMTCIPVSTSVVGSHGHFAPAVWLYAANMILGAATSWGMALARARKDASDVAESTIPLVTLIAAALLSVAISFASPASAMWAYLLTAVTAPATAWWQRRARVAE